MTDFTMKTDADGVAIITWDVPGKSMNVMSIEGLSELDSIIDTVLSDDAIKGAVITSGKDGSFAGGMDLNLLAKMREDAGDDPAQGLFDGTMKMHALLRKIERAGMDAKTNKGGKGAYRSARDHGRHLPRRGRHHPSGAQTGRDGRIALLAGRQDGCACCCEICRSDRRSCR